MTLILLALALVSCSKEDMHNVRDINYDYGRDLKHEKIVLGNRLDNPYKTENMARALKSLYPTKADRVELKSTDLYVRFLPADQGQCDLLESMGLQLVDHPVDYDIVVEGDWYHDPSVPEGDVTWQYAVVPADFQFPDVNYEIIDECYISENDPVSKSADYGIDWDAVERESYVLTGNSSMIPDQLTKASSRPVPSGRITVVDRHANGAKPFGVSGVMVVCNSFVKFSTAYTDRDGYYSMEKAFSTDVRYRLVFKNEKGFGIGLNLILLPASVSTLGKAGPEGVTMTITEDSDEKLFKRCVVNNAAYDYYSRCVTGDMGIAAPPSDLRIWLFYNLEASSAVMLHHGTILESDLIGKYLGIYTDLIRVFLPDITLGVKGKDSYRDLYDTTCHELAHASHFTKAGRDFWNRYIFYIMASYVATSGKMYGDGTGEDAGVCEVGEMWAYYLESKMYKDRYGGDFPSYGISFWFYPQIFRYMDERGVSCSEIFSVLGPGVESRSDLKAALLTAYPKRRTVIEQVFGRYR
jgi:hypothetical protein